MHGYLSRAPANATPATAEAGDVILCHPFLAHTFNPIGSSRPRYISNVAVHAFADLNLDKTAHELSPVEAAILGALDENS